jgi:hypothetical protein
MCTPVTGMKTDVAGATCGGAIAPAAAPAASMVTQLEAVKEALARLASTLGGGMQAAVAGASGDATATGAGPVPDAKTGGSMPSPKQCDMFLPAPMPPAVGGDYGPGKVGQTPAQVGGDNGPGKGKGKGRGKGLKLGHTLGPIQSGRVGGDQGPGQVGQTPVKGEKPKVGGHNGPGQVGQTPVKADEPKADEPKAEEPQVGGSTGPGQIGQTPVKADEPKAEEPQVGGSTGPGQVGQSPTKAPTVSEVVAKEYDRSNVIRLDAQDGSRLEFFNDVVRYTSASGRMQSFQVPSAGFALELSDGTRVSGGYHQTHSSSDHIGTPRDLEVIGPDGSFAAIRTDDDRDSTTQMPLTSFHLMEIVSLLKSTSFADFGKTPIQS